MSCECPNVTIDNTGKPGCVPLAAVGKKLFLVPLYDSTGTRNSVDLTATLNAAYFSGKINQTDISKRWLPLPEIKNITDERADSDYETFNDGSKRFVKNGIRSFVGLMPGESPEFKGKLEQFACDTWGVFIADKDGNLIGSKGTAVLYPIALEEGSLDAKLVKATDTTIQSISLSFQYSSIEQDKDLRMILASESIGLALLLLSGLIDINMTIVSTGQTSMVIKLVTDFGSPINPIVVKGLLAANFFDAVGGVASKLYNVTDSASVSITSVTENPDGTYTLAYASQTLGDQLRITIVKTGYDATRVDDTYGTVA